jgi:hypothetical protein
VLLHTVPGPFGRKKIEELMYLFEKEYTFNTHPYPYLIIENVLPKDVADKLAEEFPTDLGWGTDKYNAINYPKDSIWEEFYNTNMSHIRDIIDILDTAFQKEPSETNRVPKVNYTYYEDTEKRMLRGWHVDAEDKKYQILLYLGDLLEGGEIEMWNGTDIVSFPFKHNRMIAWYNNTNPDNGILTHHRYFSGNGGRKVFNIPIVY